MTLPNGSPGAAVCASPTWPVLAGLSPAGRRDSSERESRKAGFWPKAEGCYVSLRVFLFPHFSPATAMRTSILAIAAAVTSAMK